MKLNSLLGLVLFVNTAFAAAEGIQPTQQEIDEQLHASQLSVIEENGAILVQDINDSKYDTSSTPGNLPDPDLDPGKFSQLKANVAHFLENNCQDGKTNRYCTSLQSVYLQMGLSENMVIRHAIGPAKTMGGIIGLAECKYWGSAKNDKKNSKIKSFFKTLGHVAIYPFLQVYAFDHAVKNYSAAMDPEARDSKGWPIRDENGNVIPKKGFSLGKVISPIARLVAIPTSVGIAIMYSPTGLGWGLARSLGANMERDDNCSEKGWFN